MLRVERLSAWDQWKFGKVDPLQAVVATARSNAFHLDSLVTGFLAAADPFLGGRVRERALRVFTRRRSRAMRWLSQSSIAHSAIRTSPGRAVVFRMKKSVSRKSSSLAWATRWLNSAGVMSLSRGFSASRPISDHGT